LENPNGERPMAMRYRHFKLFQSKNSETMVQTSQRDIIGANDACREIPTEGLKEEIQLKIATTCDWNVQQR
jgi:hypothetical protein